MTIMQECGLVGPFKSLSKEDKSKYLKSIRLKRIDHYREKTRERNRKYYALYGASYGRSKEYVKAYSLKYRSSDKYKAWRKQYIEKNRERINAKNKEWRQRNMARVLESNSLWEKRNKQSVYPKRRIYRKNRMKNDLGFRLRCNLSSRLCEVLKKQDSKISHRFGFSGLQLKSHLEHHFLPGMSWDNYGPSGWHVDHHIPCAAFDLTKPDQVKSCFSLENLRPLWAKDNLKKGGNMPSGVMIIPRSESVIR